MSKKSIGSRTLKAGAALLAVGAGVAAINAKNKNGTEKKEIKEIQKKEYEQYRNTERGKYDKNSKGIYYSNGNYEAFARPEKPEGVDAKSAYIVGSGLASLAAACFLVRDGQMKGSHIHILEAMDIAGGACDGINDPTRGYVMRGGREMENHFECLWDLFRSIPSLEKPGASVLDEYYWLNKHDPNYSLCRATVNQGAIGAFYSKKNVNGTMSVLNQIPVVNADVVTGFSLCILLVVVFGVSKNTYIPLIIGHTVLSAPFVYLAVVPKLKQMDPSLYEAALDLGATPGYSLIHIIIPQIASGIVSGFVMAVTLSLDDYFVATYTKPATFDTISTYVVNATKGSQTNIKTALWALSTIIFLIVVIVEVVMNFAPIKNEAQKEKH